MAALDRTRYRESGGVIRTKAYIVWDAIIQRCCNPKNPNYKHYGGRGISVCERWRSFDEFYKDMGDPPNEMEIDRKDNNGNSEPDNCRWVTRKENMRNTRRNHNIKYNRLTKCLEEWGEETGIKPNTILTRIRRGWTIGEALGFKDHHNKTTLTEKEKKKRKKKCGICRNVFTPRPNQVRDGFGKYCSLKCSAENARNFRHTIQQTEIV